MWRTLPVAARERSPRGAAGVAVQIIGSWWRKYRVDAVLQLESPRWNHSS